MMGWMFAVETSRPYTCGKGDTGSHNDRSRDGLKIKTSITLV
jgi:hypothetical protein